ATFEQLLNQSSAARILQELPRYNWLEQKILQRNSYPPQSQSSSTSPSASSSTTPTTTTTVTTTTTSGIVVSTTPSLPQSSGTGGCTLSSQKSRETPKGGHASNVRLTASSLVHSSSSFPPEHSNNARSAPKANDKNYGSVIDLSVCGASDKTTSSKPKSPYIADHQSFTAPDLTLCRDAGVHTLVAAGTSDDPFAAGRNSYSVTGVAAYSPSHLTPTTLSAAHHTSHREQFSNLSRSHWGTRSVALPRLVDVYGGSDDVHSEYTGAISNILVTAPAVVAVASSHTDGINMSMIECNAENGRVADDLGDVDCQVLSLDYDAPEENDLTIDLSPPPEPESAETETRDEDANEEAVVLLTPDTSGSAGDKANSSNRGSHSNSIQLIDLEVQETSSQARSLSPQSHIDCHNFEVGKNLSSDAEPNNIRTAKTGNESELYESSVADHAEGREVTKSSLADNHDITQFSNGLYSSPESKRTSPGGTAQSTNSTLDFSSSNQASSCPTSKNSSTLASKTTVSESPAHPLPMSPTTVSAKASPKLTDCGNCELGSSTEVKPSKDSVDEEVQKPTMDEAKRTVETSTSVRNSVLNSTACRHSEKAVEVTVDSAAQNEAAPLDLCVKKSETTTTGSSVPRTRGHLPVQMVLPQIQAQRPPNVPLGSAVVTSSSVTTLSPPAHCKTFNKLPRLTLSSDRPYFPFDHHSRYGALHSGVVELNSTGMEASPPTESNLRIDVYPSHSYKIDGLALRALEENVSTAYEHAESVMVVEENSTSAPGTALGPLTAAAMSTSPTLECYPARSAVLLPESRSGKVGSAATNLLDNMNNEMIESASHSNSGLTTSVANESDTIGITAPYHMTPSSALALSDAELEQEFQQHLLEFKALEELAERKAREQMQVALMRKRKAEMLRAMEIKKARRDILLKDDKCDLGKGHRGSVDGFNLTHDDSKGNDVLGVSTHSGGTAQVKGGNDINHLKASSIHSQWYSSTAPSQMNLSSSDFGEHSTQYYIPTGMSGRHSYTTNKVCTVTSSAETLTNTQSAFNTNQDVVKDNSNNNGGATIVGNSTIETSDLIQPLNLSAGQKKSPELSSDSNSSSPNGKGITFNHTAVLESSQTHLPVSKPVAVATKSTSTVSTGISISSSASTTFCTSSSSLILSSPGLLSPSMSSEGPLLSNITTSVNKSTKISSPTTKSVSRVLSTTLCSAPTCTVNTTNSVCSVASSESDSTTPMLAPNSCNTLESCSSVIGTDTPRASTDVRQKCESPLHKTFNEDKDFSEMTAPAASPVPTTSSSVMEFETTVDIKMEIVENDIEMLNHNSDLALPLSDNMAIIKLENNVIAMDKATADCIGENSASVTSEEADRSRLLEKLENSNAENLEDEEGEKILSNKGLCIEQSSTAVDQHKNATIASESEELPYVEKTEPQSMEMDTLDDDPLSSHDTSSANPEKSDPVKIEILAENTDEITSYIGYENASEKTSTTGSDHSLGVSTSILTTTSEARVSCTPEGNSRMDEDSLKENVDEISVPAVKVEINSPLNADRSGDTPKNMLSTTKDKSPIPDSPMAAHQAPTDTLHLKFDNKTLELNGPAHNIKSAYERRNVAVFEPPFVLESSGEALDLGSSPQPAHSQKPFQIVGTLLQPSTTTTGSKISGTSKSAVPALTVHTATSTSNNNSLVPLLNESNGKERSSQSKNNVKNNVSEGQVGMMSLSRRASLDVTEHPARHKILPLSQDDQMIQLHSNLPDQANFTATPLYSLSEKNGTRSSCPEGAPSVLGSQENQDHSTSVSCHRHDSIKSTDSYVRQHSASSVHLLSGSQDAVGSRAHSDAIGVKRSAFKTIDRKQTRDNSVIDLSIDRVNSSNAKNAFFHGRPNFSSDHDRQRPQISSTQDMQSIASTEFMYQQGRRSDPGVHTRLPIPPGHPLYNDNAAKCNRLPSPSSMMHSGPSSFFSPSFPLSSVSSSSSYKRAAGSIEKNRARPGGFLTMRHRLSSCDPSLRSAGLNLERNKSDNSLAGVNLPAQLQSDNMRPSISSVSQHRLQYQKADGGPMSNQMYGPALLSGEDVTTSSGLTLSPVGPTAPFDVHQAARGGANSLQRKVSPSRPTPINPGRGGYVYCGLERGPPHQPRQLYHRHMPPTLTEIHPDKQSNNKLYHAENRGEGVGPANVDAHSESVLQRQSEAMHKPKQELHSHMSSPGYQAQAAQPVALVPTSKQNASPSGQPHTNGRNFHMEQKGSSITDSPAFRPSDYRVQPTHTNNPIRPHLEPQHHLQHHHQMKQMRHQNQQPSLTSGPGKAGCPPTQQLYGPGTTLTKSPYGSMHPTPSFMGAFSDARAKMPQQQYPHPHHHNAHFPLGQHQQPMPMQHMPRRPPPQTRMATSSQASQNAANQRLAYMHAAHANRSLASAHLLHDDFNRQSGFLDMSLNSGTQLASQHRGFPTGIPGHIGMTLNSPHNVAYSETHQQQQQQRYPKKNPSYERRISPPPPVQHPDQVQHRQQQPMQKPLHHLPSGHYLGQPQLQDVSPTSASHLVLYGTGSGNGSVRGRGDGTANRQMADNNVCQVCGNIALFLCSSCRQVWYCNQQCQSEHWAVHAPNCKVLTDSQATGM
ncbi:hypothetical protein PoB_005408300, partial [Plakobranchus ocellatus]